jgi:L-lactate dehydrogenase complex protein LldG
MSARDDILSAIRRRPYRSTTSPQSCAARAIENPVGAFVERAQLANAEVRVIDSEADVPQAISELLRARNLPAVVHVPPSAAHLSWERAPNLTIEGRAPGADDVTIAIAPFGIAETGTLAYPCDADTPASWHFRAGLEIAVVRADSILAHMEDVIGRLKLAGLPSTLNFVTGPSRTGDIEQTLELGAHGPKALAILIIRGSGL